MAKYEWAGRKMTLPEIAKAEGIGYYTLAKQQKILGDINLAVKVTRKKMQKYRNTNPQNHSASAIWQAHVDQICFAANCSPAEIAENVFRYVMCQYNPRKYDFRRGENGNTFLWNGDEVEFCAVVSPDHVVVTATLASGIPLMERTIYI